MRLKFLLAAASLTACAASPVQAPPSAFELGTVGIEEAQAANVVGCGAVLWRQGEAENGRWLMAEDYETAIIRLDGAIVTLTSRPALAPASPDAAHRVFLDETGTVRVDERLTRGRVTGDEVWQVAGTLSVTRGEDRIVIPVDGEEGC